MSNKSNNQITEAINLNEVTSILLNKGFMLYRPEVDINGVDFLLKTPLGFIQKCQLKSRAYVEWNRYGGKDIFMVFPGKGDVGNRDWYLIPHDKLFGILKQKHGHAPQWNHVKHGEYWHCPVSGDLAEYLTEYSIDNPNINGYQILHDQDLTKEMFEIDAKKDKKKLLEVGYSINGYEILPKNTSSDILSALRKEFFDNPESDYEFQTLRLVLFFELRCLHHKGVAEDKDYERLNLILRKMSRKYSLTIL